MLQHAMQCKLGADTAMPVLLQALHTEWLHIADQRLLLQQALQCKRDDKSPQCVDSRVLSVPDTHIKLLIEVTVKHAAIPAHIDCVSTHHTIGCCYIETFHQHLYAAT